ncbi:MAG: hypothetical protein MHM6MM_002149 [Cercozoa sp. M6MM]
MEQSLDDVRVAMIGNVDSGKSTMIGVLTGGLLDDGRGGARSRIFRHGHEAETGRTSAIAQHIMGFDESDEAVHQQDNANSSARNKTISWSAVIEKSNRLVTFIDLAGHERYLKTTVQGLTGCFPDYACIIVAANQGVLKMTKEHISVACSLRIPTMVLVTKVDMTPQNVLKHTYKQLVKLLKSPLAGRRMPLLLKSDAAVDELCNDDTLWHRACPILLVSSVTGHNLDRLQKLLRQLRPQRAWLRQEPPLVTNDDGTQQPVDAEIEIDETFTVTGVGLVLSGTVTHGEVNKGDSMLLGPFDDGIWRRVLVRSLHQKRVSREKALSGQSCSVALRFVKTKERVDRAHIRRGMVLVNAPRPPIPAQRFEAQMLVLHHPTTIKAGYEPVVHCGNVRQTVLMLYLCL